MTKGLRKPVCVRRTGRSVRIGIRGVIFILLFFLGLPTAYSQTIGVRGVGFKGRTGERTITLEFTGPVHYSSFTLTGPPRLVLDIPGVTLKEPRTIKVNNEVVKNISYEQYQPDAVRIIVNLTQPAKSRVQKAGRKILLHFSLPRKVRERLLTEERAKAREKEAMKKVLAARERARIKLEQEKAKRLALAREAELKAKQQEAQRLEAEKRAREKEKEKWASAEGKARQLLEQRMKRETELSARKVRAETISAEETAQREARNKERDIASRLARGEKYSQAGQFDKAISEFEAVLTLNPENKKARNYLTLARDGQEEKQRQQAISLREKEKERTIAEHLSRGKGYYFEGRYAEAISEGEKVLALSPNNNRAEDIIMQSKKQVLGMEKKQVQAEKSLVEERRSLDVTKAIYTSPVNYASTINPEKVMLNGKGSAASPKKIKEKEAVNKLTEKAEKTMVTMNFKDTGLYDVILFLSKMSKVNIVIDQRALDELANPNVSIYIPTPIPLTDALDLVLKVKGLDYVIKENYIWIAKKGQEQAAVTEAYKLKYGIRKIRAVTLTPLQNQNQNR